MQKSHGLGSSQASYAVAGQSAALPDVEGLWHVCRLFEDKMPGTRPRKVEVSAMVLQAFRTSCKIGCRYSLWARKSLQGHYFVRLLANVLSAHCELGNGRCCCEASGLQGSSNAPACTQEARLASET